MAGFIQKLPCPFRGTVFDQMYMPRIDKIQGQYNNGTIDEGRMKAEIAWLRDYFEWDTERLKEAVLVGQFGDEPGKVYAYCEILSQIDYTPALRSWCPVGMLCKYFRNPGKWISVGFE